jgi:hypothetical protein
MLKANKVHSRCFEFKRKQGSIDRNVEHARAMDVRICGTSLNCKGGWCDE